MLIEDPRTLLQTCMNSAGATVSGLCKTIDGLTPAALTNMLGGSSAVSVRAFCGVVRGLGLEKNTELLRYLLYVYVADKLGEPLAALFREAGWLADPGVMAGIGSAKNEKGAAAARAIYRKLSPVDLSVGKRRLWVIRALQGLSADEKTGLVPSVQVNGATRKYERATIRKDLLTLQELGYLKSRLCNVALPHEFTLGRSRTRSMRCWGITKAGKALLKEARGIT